MGLARSTLFGLPPQDWLAGSNGARSAGPCRREFLPVLHSFPAPIPVLLILGPSEGGPGLISFLA